MNLLLHEHNLALPTCSDNRGSKCTNLLKVSILASDILSPYYTLVMHYSFLVHSFTTHEKYFIGYVLMYTVKLAHILLTI